MISFKEFCRINESIPVSAQGAMKYINLIMKGIKAKSIEISDVKNNMYVVTFTNIPKLNNQNMSLLLNNSSNKMSNIIGVALSDEILDTTAKFKTIPSSITSIKDVINGLNLISKITSVAKPVGTFKDNEDLNVVILSGEEDKPKNLKPKTKNDLIGIINKIIKERGLDADLNDIDVSEITDMSELFQPSPFNDSNISKWDISILKNISKINCNISKWDVSNVTDMSYMFYESNFNGDISNWNVSKVKDMSYMFFGSRFNNNISKWDVSNVKNMDYMFADSPLESNPPEWYKD